MYVTCSRNATSGSRGSGNSTYYQAPAAAEWKKKHTQVEMPKAASATKCRALCFFPMSKVSEAGSPGIDPVPRD